MNNKSENHGGKVSLFYDAFSSVEQAECVSHSVKYSEGKDKKPTDLATGNHAFYIGKFFPESVSGKLKRVLGVGKTEDRIYSREFIKGGLEYLLRNTKQGEKTRVVVARCFSELFNGKDDVQDAISTDEEIALIKHIADKEFSAGDDRLEVVDLEKEPRHSALFAGLRKSADTYTGIADVEKVLGSEAGSAEKGSSLWIASLLYSASQKSEQLMEAFEDTMPAKLKSGSDKNPSSKYYGLTEIAIRLSDILNGCFVHGGAERQALYNSIIINLIKGEAGRFSGIEELKPLFDLLKNCRFETLSLQDEDNVYQKKQLQSTARYRLMVYGALAASAIGGIFGAGRLYEQKKAEKREASVQRNISKNLKGVVFRVESKFDISKEYNPDVFKRVMRSAKMHIMARYSISDKQFSKMEPFFKSFILKKLGVSSYIHEEGFGLIDAVDEFVLSNQIFFSENDIETDIPYKKLLEELQKYSAGLNGEDFTVRDRIPMSQDSKATFIEKLGIFYSGTGFNDRFEFGIFRDENDSSHLVARDYNGNSLRYDVFSSKKAKLGMWQIEYAMRKHALVPLRGQLSSILNSMHFSDSQVQYCEKASYPNEPSITNALGGAEYVSHPSGTIISVITSKGFDETGQLTECPLAAVSGDKEFTFERGKEVVAEVSGVYDGLLRHARNDMPGE